MVERCSVCQKVRGTTNAFNWQRHVTSCRKKYMKKRRFSAEPIHATDGSTSSPGTDCNQPTQRNNLDNYLTVSKRSKRDEVDMNGVGTSSCSATSASAIRDTSSANSRPPSPIPRSSHSSQSESVSTQSVADPDRHVSLNSPSSEISCTTVAAPCHSGDLVDPDPGDFLEINILELGDVEIEPNVTAVYNETEPSEQLEIIGTATTSSSTSNSFETVWKNDPWKFMNLPQTSELIKYQHKLGPCQPKEHEMPNGVFPKNESNRCFTSIYYNMKLPDGTFVPRKWLEYSPSQDRIFCSSCRIHGTSNARSLQFVRVGSNDWNHTLRVITIHESRPEHVESEIRKSLYLSNQRVDMEIIGAHNARIAENREVVKILMCITLFLARHCLAFRGKKESKKINNIAQPQNRGNFLDLTELLAQYHPQLASHLAKIQSETRSRVTFLSNRSQNDMLRILSDMTTEAILKEVKESGMFSVIADTTTDISLEEQFAFVVRYCPSSSKSKDAVSERLIDVKSVTDGTALGLFEVFKEICQEHGLDWKNHLIGQAYDGAANMQGQYKGLRTLVQAENPRALYVWCFAHRLNLVVVDMCDSCTELKNFFGTLQSLVRFFKCRTRKQLFIETQKEFYPKRRTLCLPGLSTTRWTSHDRTVTALFKTYGAVVDTLEKLNLSSDREAASTANSLKDSISKFQFVVTMHVVKKIFDVTTPLSLYLQSINIDFVQAIAMVDTACKKLSAIRKNAEAELDNLFLQATDFADENELEETGFPVVRVRKAPQKYGEKAADESRSCLSDPKVRYRVNVFLEIISRVESSITERFSEDSRSVLRDMSVLLEERLKGFENGDPIPDDAFEGLANWLGNMNAEDLRQEALSFAKNCSALRASSKLPAKLHPQKPGTGRKPSETETTNEFETDGDGSVLTDPDDSSDSDEVIDGLDKDGAPLQNSLIDSYMLLKTNNLQCAFPKLFVAYKGTCTLPPSSASAERRFSKLLLIKTRLRTTTEKKRLKYLMILGCEQDIDIDLNEAVDRFAMKSELLRKCLLFT